MKEIAEKETLVINAASNYVTSNAVQNSEDYKAFKKIVIEEGITEIKPFAFRGCTELVEVVTPKSLRVIGHVAFSGCTNLTSFVVTGNTPVYGMSSFFHCTSLTDIKLPESAEEIFNAFYGCTSLPMICRNSKLVLWQSAKGDVEIPDGITEIAAEAFTDCRELTSVVIPESVKVIGDRAFIGCTNLTDVRIPKGVKVIGDRVFDECTSLPMVCHGTKLIAWQSAKGKVVIPDGITEIAGGAFANCNEMTSVVIPESVKVLGAEAFTGCISLTDIQIPKGSVTELGDGVFNDCISLPMIRRGTKLIAWQSARGEVVIPDGITTIAAGAFANCCELTGVVIPESVTEIEGNAFFGCTSLPMICRGTKLITWQSAKGDVVIPDGITEIAGGAFANCIDMTSVVIPASVTKIAANAFPNCCYLTSVVIPEGVTVINEYAFYNCFRMTSVVLPESLKEIAYKSFYTCASLKDLTIPAGVTKIDEEAFRGSGCEDKICKTHGHLFVKDPERDQARRKNRFLGFEISIIK